MRRVFSPPLFSALSSLLFILCSQLCQAQVQGPDGVFYSQKPAFKIPFETKPGDRTIQNVLLYVSEDQGRTWQEVARAQPAARPEDNYFIYQTRHDGFHWFTVRTQDVAGRLNLPAPDPQTKPMLKVCVLSQPPAITLRPVPARDGMVGVEWLLRDDAVLDLDTLRLEYRTSNSQWMPLSAERSASGKYTWSPAANTALDVRLQVRDRAGNLGEAATVVNGDYRPDPQPGSAPSALGVQRVNSKQISLRFDLQEVGKSGVAAVELWYTQDKGQKWQKYARESGSQSPFLVEVEGEGLYGFTLIARSGVGLGERQPRANDPPQVLVEVDLTPPKVKLQGVEVGRGVEAGKLIINWTASDKNNNLTSQPITLLYSENPSGPWTPIAAKIDNKGRYSWPITDAVPPKIYVRVEAADLAGNIGSDETAKEVIVDLAQPKVRVLGVESAGK